MSYHALTPQFILDRARSGQSSGTLDAVCLFIDLSGFTPLTIALMAYGTEGAEVLARVLAGVFEPLIDSVYEHGGFTAGFAGDAFKAIFPIQIENERDRLDTYLHALAAAWEIRQHLTENPHQTTRFGDFRFTGKVCAAAGDVNWQIWRDVENSERSQTAAALFGGEALRACMSIDPYASTGEIVVAESVRKALPESLMHVTPVGAHFRVDQLDVPQSDTRSPERTESPVSDRRTVTAKAFYPAWLLTSRIQGEFRQAVTVFINFERHFTDAELARFQPVLFQLIDQYDGFLGRIGQIGDKDNGNTLLLFWGAPTGSERDANRALRFLLDLRAAC